jgi:hypothetical protein
MLALVTLVGSILRISANASARSKAREDMVSFVLEFEKDLRNATQVGNCSGQNAQFVCDIYTNTSYRWAACPRVVPPLCSELGDDCDTKGIEITLCKYRLGGSGLPDGEPIVKFNELYNLEDFGVTLVETSIGAAQGGQSEQTGQPGQTTRPGADDITRRAVAFTIAVSHPNKRLGIENLVRQSIISTKNFELTVQK